MDEIENNGAVVVVASTLELLAALQEAYLLERGPKGQAGIELAPEELSAFSSSAS